MLAILAGGIWAAIPGYLKAKHHTNEMIITILLNYIATLFMSYLYSGPLMEDRIPQTAAVDAQIKLTRFLGSTRAHTGILLALLFVGLVYYFLFHTYQGYSLRVVGVNRDAARVNGFAVERYMILSFVISGMIAGLGGAVELLGASYRAPDGLRPGLRLRRRRYRPHWAAAPAGNAAGRLSLRRPALRGQYDAGRHRYHDSHCRHSARHYHYLRRGWLRPCRAASISTAPGPLCQKKGGQTMTALFFLDNITGATLRMMTPLLLVALGELYSERAGLTNIGLDGIMSIGTIAGFLAAALRAAPGWDCCWVRCAAWH